MFCRSETLNPSPKAEGQIAKPVLDGFCRAYSLGIATL
jgi:hypothetical protein